MDAFEQMVAKVAEFEGFRTHAYWDKHGQMWTVGYGTTSINLRKVRLSDHLSEPQARNLLRDDLRSRWNLITGLYVLHGTPRQIAALTSLAHNIGTYALKRSTLLRYHNRRLFALAGDEFLKWTKAGGVELPGLVRRRHWERALYLEQEPRALVPV